MIASSKHTRFSLLGSIQKRVPRLNPQLYTSQSRGGQYRNLDLGRSGIVIVHRRSAKGLGFDTVVIPDTHEDAATDPTSAALRMSYYVMATRARRELHLGYEGQSEPPLLAQVNRGDLQRGWTDARQPFRHPACRTHGLPTGRPRPKAGSRCRSAGAAGACRPVPPVCGG